MPEAPPQTDDAPDPDSWSRFERAVDAALHTPPKHKPKAGDPDSEHCARRVEAAILGLHRRRVRKFRQAGLEDD
jgi:hypothetical protein